MATNLKVTPQATPLATKLAEATSANATACNDVFGGAAELLLVEIDNSQNVGEDVYLKLYDDAGPTVGTDAPDWIFKADGGAFAAYAIPSGASFSNLSFAVTTSPGNAGVANPAAQVDVRIVAK